MKTETSTWIRQGKVGAYLLRHTLILFPGLLSLTGLSLVDVYFVGKLGPEALAAISFAAPVFLVGLSLVMGLGTGITTVLSHKIGRSEEVSTAIFSSWILSIVLGLVLAGTGYVFHRPIFQQLGANEEMLALLTPYMQIIYPAFLVVSMLIGTLSSARAYGDNRLPALVMGWVVVLNALLDPVLILGWGGAPALGMEGAAWATFIALCLGLLLAGMGVRKYMLPSARMQSSWTEYLNSWHPMLYVATPVAITRTLLPLSSAVVIGMLASFDNGVVAAYGVGYRLDVTLSMFTISLSSVLAPFVGQNYGAGNINRMKKGIAWSTRAALIYGVVVGAGLMALREPLAGLFSDDPEVIRYLSDYFLLVPWGYGLAGLLVLATSTLNVLNRPLWASGVSLGHLFVFYLPLAGLADSYEAVFLAYPIATGMACGVAWWLVKKRIFAIAMQV